MLEPIPIFNLNEWLARRDLTTQELTDYLNTLGYEVSRRTVEGWRSLGAPRWLGPLLAQRDGMCELYDVFSPLADAQLAAGHAAGQADFFTLREKLNEVDKLADQLEGIFEKYLTNRERGLTEE